jgi:hypothetical protein
MLKRLIMGAIAAIACLVAIPAAATAKEKTAWLCKPGLADNPCKTGLDTTVYSPTLEQLEVKRVKAAKRPKFDCFYVYPTVSDQQSENAEPTPDPEVRSIALYQAARYSEHCRVYAPLYRQVTLTSLLNGPGFTEQNREVAYRSALAAWKTYMKKFNKGRGVVLIGHSQGTFVLSELVREKIDPKRRLRKQLISALLMGGGVTVGQGADSGGSFKHVKACRSPKQIGCVIGFSAFNEPVPADAIFGRSTEPGIEVLCANPAALGGGAAALDTVYPAEPFAPGTTIGLATQAVGMPAPPASTPFYEFRGAYTAQCSNADGANVLQLADAPGAPHLNAIPDATWGLHLADANVALGNQVDLIARQAKKYLKRR